MTKPELIERFYKNHLELTNHINSLTDDKFVYSYMGRWAAGQQLEHIYLCLKPIDQALASKEFIKQKFGQINRSIMDYDTVIETYKDALNNGGKAPDRFVPEQDKLIAKAKLILDLSQLLLDINQKLNNYAEEELDSLILPHPLLGNLTIGELIYLMTYHASHHRKQTEANLENFSKD